MLIREIVRGPTAWFISISWQHPRSVHAWDYRRYILASMPVKRPEVSELAYTTHKIESNFSNFSAWHQRSKVFISLWESGQLDPVESKEQGGWMACH